MRERVNERKRDKKKRTGNDGGVHLQKWANERGEYNEPRRENNKNNNLQLRDQGMKTVEKIEKTCNQTHDINFKNVS